MFLGAGRRWRDATLSCQGQPWRCACARNPSEQVSGCAATRKRGAPERRSAHPGARGGGAETAKYRATTRG
eukprot:11231107-Alexandrium_andersonii.AAC.1